MRALILGAAVLMTVSMSGGVAQAAEMDISPCAFPEAPTVPDGAKASEEEMGQAGSAVRAYVAGVQASLQCLTDVEKSLGEEITTEQQDQLVATYNAGVDQMNAVAGSYNTAVRVYKER